jgi:membrane associated rhomboid family serine protease
MFPLKDDVPSRSLPVVTVLLIIANCVAFFLELKLGARLETVIHVLGVVPAKFFAGGYLLDGTYHRFTFADRTIPLFTSMFLHGGWVHLIGNMWYLWIFGDNVEDRLGHFKFLLFYVMCGIAAALLQVFMAPDSTTPMVGASGAIAGVLGAYMLLYPFARVLVLFPIFIFIQFIRVPALFVLGMWFVVQLGNGSLALQYGAGGGGVAWWAHIGGFVSGMILLGFFLALFPSTRSRR